MKKTLFITTTFKEFDKDKHILIDATRYFIDGVKIGSKKVISLNDLIVAVMPDENSCKISKLIFVEQSPINISGKKAEIDLSNIDNSKAFEIPESSKLPEIFEDFLSFCKNFLDDEFRPHVLCRLNLIKEWNEENFIKIENELEKILNSSFVENNAFKDIFGTSKVSMDILSRHFLVVGETGSGKTYSVLFPVIDSLKHKIGTYSALIIDPKMNELKNRFVMNLSCKVKKENIIDIFEYSKKIDVFEGLREDTIDKKIEFLFKLSPKFYKQSENTSESYWANSSQNYIKSLIKLDYVIRKNEKRDIFSFFDEIVKKLKSDYFFEIPPATVFSKTNCSYFKKLKILSQWIAKMHIAFRDNERGVIEKIQKKLSDKNYPHIEFFGVAPVDTFTSITSVSEPFFDDWTDEVIDSVLWSNPFEELKDNLSIEQAILDKKILIFSIPAYNISEHHYRLGRIIKNKFFSFCFKTYDSRKETNTPVFYIADEFHRFITGDEETGEQSFLDRCRGYNVSCIMATQSISSLKYGISENTVYSNNDLNNSVEIVLNNCCTKFFFRTTDTETNIKLKSIIPSVPYPEFSNYGHVIDVFPVSSLETGECYFITSKGRWGKTKIKITPSKQETLKAIKIKRRVA